MRCFVAARIRIVATQGWPDYWAAVAMLACSARAAALSVASQGKPGSVRPKWPQLS